MGVAIWGCGRSNRGAEVVMSHRLCDTHNDLRSAASLLSGEFLLSRDARYRGLLNFHSEGLASLDLDGLHYAVP